MGTKLPKTTEIQIKTLETEKTSSKERKNAVQISSITRGHLLVLLCGLVAVSSCDKPSIQESVDHYANGRLMVPLNTEGEEAPKKTPALKDEKLPELTEIDKMHLRDNPSAIFDEQTGNVLCGDNRKPLIGKKLYIVTVDDITFKMRKKEDLAEDEKIVKIKLCGKVKQARKAYADLLEKAQQCMEQENSDYKNKKRGWLWRKGYWAKMHALAKSGSMTCLEADDVLRTNEQQEKIYQDSLVRDKNGNVVMEKGKPKQKYPAAKGCYSFHLTGYASDIDNWARAQSCLWQQGIAGGSRGIDKDARHFSIKEFNNAGLLRAGKNRGRDILRKITRRKK